MAADEGARALGANQLVPERQTGEVVLARAMRRRYAVRELPPSSGPVLKAYLDRFASEVQRFFPVPKGSAMGSV